MVASKSKKKVEEAPLAAKEEAVEIVAEDEVAPIGDIKEAVTVDKIIDEEQLSPEEKKNKAQLDAWNPKTALGRKVKNREITDIDTILDSGTPILEPQIVEMLLPNMESDLLLIGQAKGKFGGGKRRAFKQTQKKTMEGNALKFTSCAIIGDKNGHVGIGFGMSKETVPAREKALRNAKLNILKIRRGNGSWDNKEANYTSIPFSVMGKSGSAEVTIMPAPKGTGLKAESQLQKIFALAGIKDIRTMTRGRTKTRLNMIHATINALKNLSKTKIMHKHIEQLGIVEGSVKAE